MCQDGFEPPKPKQQIYSLPVLATYLLTLNWLFACHRKVATPDVFFPILVLAATFCSSVQTKRRVISFTDGLHLTANWSLSR